MKTNLFAALVALAVSSAGPAWAQQLGELSGRVRNADGNPAENVTVVAEHTTPAERHTAATSAQGRYRILAVPAGIYTVTASGPGFPEMVRENVRVQANDVVRVDFNMQSDFAGDAPTLERLSIAFNFAYSTITGTDTELVNPGLSLEGGARFNLGLVQIGGGLRYSTHSFRNVNHTYNTFLPFLELRKQFMFGSSRWYPFAAARAGLALESMIESGAVFRGSGTAFGGTIGIRYQANASVGIELGGSYDYFNFGDFKADVERVWRICIDQEAGTNKNTLIKTVELCSPSSIPPQVGDREFITYEGTRRSVQEFRIFFGATIMLTKVTP
jgi:hypothetical protein